MVRFDFGARWDAAHLKKRKATHKKMNMKKSIMTAVAGLAFCMLASSAQAAGLLGAYMYPLVLRNEYGLVMGMGEWSFPVSGTYTFEVYKENGKQATATLRDAQFSDSVGYNCILEVSVLSGGATETYATPGEQLTLVVKKSGSVVFRSSTILPPPMFIGIVGAPIGVFYADSDDTDNGLNIWRSSYSSDFGLNIGEDNADDDGDGLSNLREYRLGTDPKGGAMANYGFVNKPEFSIEDQGDVYKVRFNWSWWHVYSIRAIEGAEIVGKVGQDLALYESVANLNAGTSIGKYFYDADDAGVFPSGTKTYYVKKPDFSGNYMIGLAVDGQLQEYITVAQQPSAVEVTPGSPIEYDTEAAATAAQAIAVVTPSAAVAEVLTGAGAADGYKAAFTVEVEQVNEKWVLSALLMPESWTNLVENAAAGTRQIPVAGIAALPMNTTTNFVLTGCTPGFYYSLYSGATVTNITADAETENLNVLCGADGKVEFPMVKKPSEGAGFFSVGPKTSASVEPGDKLVLWPL